MRKQYVSPYRLQPVLLVAGLLIGTGILAMPRAIHGQTVDVTTTTMPQSQINDTITIPAGLAESWKGSYSLPAFSVVRRSDPSLPILLKAYIGRKDQVANQYHTYNYNPEAVYQWLSVTASTLNESPQEPSLKISNGRATSFIPPADGITINLYQSTLNVIAALDEGNTTAALAVSRTAPRTSLSELNNLGITELISRGESNLGNSPRNRRHNIDVGISKMRGVIIKPGEEFSFNKYLGPVEASEGFLPELVIKADKGTIPELGGGLCQVSSTTFRAAMKAGLPITQRRNHSYAVSYYAPQGSDATIYPGVIDLKFVNDTPASILIWPYFIDEKKNHLVFDFYGTQDSRQVTLRPPVQYDKKANGAMKASWTRTIVKDGITETKTFNSTYLPPALFHRQEQFVANPGSPNPTPSVPETPPNQTPPSIDNPDPITPPGDDAPATSTPSLP